MFLVAARQGKKQAKILLFWAKSGENYDMNGIFSQMACITVRYRVKYTRKNTAARTGHL
jgi:hypothetical protein